MAHMENDHIGAHTVLHTGGSFQLKPSALSTNCLLSPSAVPKADQIIRRPGKPVTQCDTSLRICCRKNVTGERQEPEMKDFIYKAAVLKTRDREGTWK